MQGDLTLKGYLPQNWQWILTISVAQIVRLTLVKIWLGILCNVSQDLLPTPWKVLPSNGRILMVPNRLNLPLHVNFWYLNLVFLVPIPWCTTFHVFLNYYYFFNYCGVIL